MRFTFTAIIFLSLLMLILFSGAVSISLKISQGYLTKQLDDHAQDTATALAAVLNQALAKEDRVMVQTLLRALVDHGQYNSMVVLRHGKKFIAVRREMKDLAGVPAWFMELLPMSVSPCHAEIFNGWRKIGRISVSSYTGIVYEQLWQICKNILLLFGVVWMVAYLLLAGLLALLLVPLKQMERQAIQIGSRNFAVNPRKPWFKEFSTTVDALNLMSVTISKILADQAVVIENLRCQASRDHVTNLDIFEYFRHDGSGCAKTYPTDGKRAAISLQITGLNEINRRINRAYGDRVIRLLADIFSSCCKRIDPQCLVCRVAGAGLFAVLAAGGVDELKKHLPFMVAALRKDLPCPADEIIGVRAGAFFCDAAQSLAELHLKAERVVATIVLPWQWRVQAMDEVETNVVGRGEGIESLINGKITTGDFELTSVRVTYLSDNGMDHHELLLTLDDGKGEKLRAGLLLPVAGRLGLLQTLDRKVMEKVFLLLCAEAKKACYAVNVSTVSLLEEEFQQWLLDKLNLLTEEQRGRLLLETSESLCGMHGVATFVPWLGKIRGLGCKFGFDHFGIHPEGLTMLPIIQPDYVKIDRSLLIDITHEAAFGNLVRTLSSTVHGFGITCIAPLMSLETDRQVLVSLGVDGVVEPIAAAEPG